MAVQLNPSHFLIEKTGNCGREFETATHDGSLRDMLQQ